MNIKSHINTYKFKTVVLTALICFQTSFGFAAENCLRYLDLESQGYNSQDLDNLKPFQTVSLETFDPDGDSQISVLPSYNLNKVDRLHLDRALIEEVTRLLRGNRYALKHTSLVLNDGNHSNTSLESAKILNQVFQRYEASATENGYEDDPTLIPLTHSEIVAHAIILFNITDDAKRAENALLKLRTLPAAVQYQNRVLYVMIDIFQSQRNYDAARPLMKIIYNRGNYRANY